MSASTGTTATSVAKLHDVDLRKVVQDKLLLQMVKHVTQLTRGWVVMVVDDEATRSLTQVARMSELTDCGVSILERMELERQPFPEMNVVYFIAPTAANVRRLARDFEDPNKPKYNDVYIYFVHHAGEEALSELKNAPQALLQRLKALQEVNVDFLAVEKCAFSFGMPEAFHTLYSPAMKKSESEKLMQTISSKLVSVCATLEEYPYVRYQAGHTRMETLAQMFQNKMNDYLAQNSTFSYAPKRGTLLFIDRGQDMVTPLMHESTFQAMTYDLLGVKDDQISYEAETNSGTSLGRGKSTDLQAMAAGLRELPEYREMLDASNIEQTLATGVEESGKKLKHSTIGKQLEDLFKDPKLTEKDRFRVAAVFALTQDTLKEAERNKVMQAAKLSKKHETILENMALVAGSVLYKQNGNSLISSEELKLATKKAEAVEYSNARYDPKIKSIVASALKRTLSESDYPYIITPPPQSPTAGDSKKAGPVSLRKKMAGKGKAQEATPESEHFFGEKMIVFVSGGATYSELRSIYEVRSEEKRDVLLGTTSFVAPPTFIELLATLQEANPTFSLPISGQGAEVMPLTSGEIHLQVEAQQLGKPASVQ
ncbi:hypothetical protein PC120_g13790 [Phytophthora cactorum]|nr:hypothetical protein PC120_g13790 [Phytophthora cactorum]